MKKIIFFSKNLNIGGMEKALVELLNNLVNNYNVTLVLEEKTGCLLKEINTKVKIEEFRLAYDKNIFIRKLKNIIKRLLWSIKNAKKYDFSCNYATYSFCGSRLSQIASKNSAIYIHSDYYSVFNGNKEELKNFFENHKIEKFKHLIFVSNESRDNFLKVYSYLENRSVVINNLINFAYIKKMAEEKVNLHMDKNKINYIFIGRLNNESKNLNLLLLSFKELINNDKKVTLYIVGDGPYKKEITKFLKENKLENNIILIGEKINPYPYLLQSDALILTSNYEGFPVVYLEALVLNKTIITTVPTSDINIDIRNYCVIIDRNKKDIVKQLMKFSKQNNDYNLDFDVLNEKNIKKLKEVIEVK